MYSFLYDKHNETHAKIDRPSWKFRSACNGTAYR